MGWLRNWIGEWRDTYEAYPVATALTWLEMLTALGLFVGTTVVLSTGGEVPTLVGAGFVGAGVAFAVWFTTLRQPVVERLMAE